MSTQPGNTGRAQRGGGHNATAERAAQKTAGCGVKREDRFLLGAATFVVVMLGMLTLRSCV